MENCGCRIIEKFQLTDLERLKIVRCMPVLATRRCIKFRINRVDFDKKGSKKFRQKKLVSLGVYATDF